MQNKVAATDYASLQNLRRLLLLRNIAISCEVIAVIVASQILHIPLPLLPALTIIFAYGVVNIFLWLRTKRLQQVTAREFAIQLALDTLFFTLLLYFLGGYTNPFVSLFLLPLIITAATLPKLYTWAMAGLTIACYTLLMFYYQPLAQSHHGHDHGSGDEFDLHVLGMWFSFLLSAGIVVFFVVKMAGTLRERDEELAKAREKSLQDEHLVALGTLATGAAHELGTPLSTMAVLTNELKHDSVDSPDVLDKAETIRQQINRCKDIISNITASTGHAIAEGGHEYHIDQYLKEVITQWQALRPSAKFRYTPHGITPAPTLIADKTLTQALLNLLNNAADAATTPVELHSQWDDKQLELIIRDHGPGMNNEVQTMAGTLFYTTKKEGHGLGLYLATAVLERYGATLELNNHPQGGTQAHVVLPLVRLS